MATGIPLLSFDWSETLYDYMEWTLLTREQALRRLSYAQFKECRTWWR